MQEDRAKITAKSLQKTDKLPTNLLIYYTLEYDLNGQKF